MPKIGSAPTAIAALPAEVMAIYPTNRIIDIRWLSQEGGKRGVVVVSSHGDYSFPKVGDTGLVLQYGFNFFYLGRVDMSYAAKLAGNVRDKLTGQKLRPTEVDGGEAHLENVATKSYARFANNGDFSILNGFREGLKYMLNLRRATLSAKTLELLGNGVKIMFGTAIRNPGTGEIPPPGTSGGKVIEFLLQIAYQDIQTVRFHLGEIVDLIAGTVPEMSSFGARLKALLEVTAGPAPLASLKMDEVGNVEMAATTGQMKLSALTKMEQSSAAQFTQSSIGPFDISSNSTLTASARGQFTQSSVGPFSISSDSTLTASAQGVASIDGSLVQLGGAIEQAVKGTTRQNIETPMLTALTAFAAAMNVFLTGLTPLTLVAQANAAQPTAATLLAALQAFQLSYSTSLSTKTFVG